MKWSVSVISVEDEPLLHCPSAPSWSSSDSLENEMGKKKKKKTIMSISDSVT